MMARFDIPKSAQIFLLCLANISCGSKDSQSTYVEIHNYSDAIINGLKLERNNTASREYEITGIATNDFYTIIINTNSNETNYVECDTEWNIIPRFQFGYGSIYYPVLLACKSTTKCVANEDYSFVCS